MKKSEHYYLMMMMMMMFGHEETSVAAVPRIVGATRLPTQTNMEQQTEKAI